MLDSRKPEIRFKGFEDDWEQRKLGELVTIERGGSPRPIDAYITDAQDGLNWVKIGDAPEQGRYITHTEEKIKPSGLSKTRQVFPGDLILSNSMSFGKPYIMGIPGCIHDGWLLIRNSQNVFDLKFLCQMLGTKQMLAQYRQLAAGSTVNNLNKELVSNAIVKVPERAEQEQIGVFLENLDNVITLHQREYEKLQAIKKSMLENCFPRDGECVPRIRFSGFTGDWEQCKLSDIYGTIRNAFVGTASPYYVEDGHFYLESNNVKDGRINKNTQVFINDDFYYRQKDKWLHTGDMVMVQSGHVGHSAVIPKSLDNTAAHALIMFQNQKIETDPYFLNAEYQTGKSKKQIDDITKGNTIKHILASDMKSFAVMVPSLQEQHKIADCFNSLDRLITLHRRRKDKLQQIKLSMLEKMFV